MPFCRCGELCREDKCTKCGFNLNSRRNSLDPWQSRYLGNMMGLTSPTENSEELLSPRVQHTVSPIIKQISKPFSTLLDSRKVIPSKSSFTDIAKCNVCHDKLTGKTVRLAGSPYKCHWACLKCKSCEKPFEDTSFIIDPSKNVYHKSCAPPPPQQCSQCSQTIRDKYLSINSRTLHPGCFKCTKCQKILSPSSIYTDLDGSFCQLCSNSDAAEHVKIVPQLQTIATQNVATSSHPKDTKSVVVRPSTLMCSRGRPLPKFGVAKECAGCKERIYSVHEEAPGPKASKWHKKCLVCEGCSKKLDSGATVYEDDTKSKLSPWCTTCLLSKRKKSIGSLSMTASPV